MNTYFRDHPVVDLVRGLNNKIGEKREMKEKKEDQRGGTEQYQRKDNCRGGKRGKG